MAKAKTLVEEIQAYDRLLHHLEKYKGMDVLRFDELAATQYQHLRSLKLRVATMDLKIAAIALANNATLFTRNLRDFSRIPDLHAEDAAR